MLAEQRQELLRPTLARSWPQPSPRSAAHDERDDGFRHCDSSSWRCAASYFVMTPIPGGEAADALFDRRRRPEAHIAHQIINVGASFGHVARLHRRHFLNCGAAKFSF